MLELLRYLFEWSFWAQVGWFILLIPLGLLVGIGCFLDWLFPKKRPFNWFLNRIGA